MITITLSEIEARALMQLMHFVMQRGCDMAAGEAAIIINRRVTEAMNAHVQDALGAFPMKPNGAAVAKEAP